MTDVVNKSIWKRQYIYFWVVVNVLWFL